ncbi:TetR/AcrR family transcriptional regulator [soil metagenome]
MTESTSLESRLGGSPAKRDQLLDTIVGYVLENGVSQLTLRNLARAAGSNNRMLLYYFGTRENLIVAALQGAEDRFPGMQAIIAGIDNRAVPLDSRLFAAWQTISDPSNRPFHRLFFEIFGIAGFQHQQFTDLLTAISTEWVAHVAAAFSDVGVPDARALVFAHELVALWRGLQATLLSMGDEDLVNRAAVEATEALLVRVRHAASC